MIEKNDSKKNSENKIASIPSCRECGVILTDENWSPSNKKGPHYICRKCANEKAKIW